MTTHIADVQRISFCPEKFRAKCRCGKWELVDTIESLKTIFEMHKVKALTEEANDYERELR